MSICRLLGPPLLKLYFDEPRKSLKNTHLCEYKIFNPIHVCTHNFWFNTCIHREMFIKTKTFGVFLIESWITWLLAFHMLGNTSTRPSIFYWSDILSLLDALKEENFGEQGNYSSLLPHLFMLESASLCPFGGQLLLFPSFPFLCMLSIVMEVSPFWWGSNRVCHYSISVLLIEISISPPIHL